MKDALIKSDEIKTILPDFSSHLAFVCSSTSLFIDNIHATTYPESTRRMWADTVRRFVVQPLILLREVTELSDRKRR
jgi:hypothetical protein